MTKVEAQDIGQDIELQELTHYALREPVKAVYVETPDKNSGKLRNDIHISYDLVSFIPLEELAKQKWHDRYIMPFLKVTVTVLWLP